MKICLAWYPIDDPGGIINHNEQLTAGLKDLGHQVDTLLFMPRDTYPRNGKAGGTSEASPYTHMKFDQRKGYTWPGKFCVPYRGKLKAAAIDRLNSYDLVIWQVAVPTKRKENRGNSDWLDLYFECTAGQIAVIHDGNFTTSYPWLYHVKSQLEGIVCVHHCAYNSASRLSVESTLVFNPFQIRNECYAIDERSSFEKRRKGFLSVQTFKAWKHVPELVAAVPHAPGIEKHLAGKGIDYYYLTSKDKCKYPGIWESAIESGMVYHGVISNAQRDGALENLTCLVDPSWSKKYSQIGGHFNRTPVEAIMQGAVPIIRPLGIGTDPSGVGELFVNGENCIAIPQHATPEEYGAALVEACNLPYEQYEILMCEAKSILGKFERVHVAKKFLEVAEGGYDQRPLTTDASIVDLASRAMKEFFYD